ncbi:polysaccharide pyruvyl transferase family protein [Bacteroides graminisolvens]|uniref:polysaccharide pyruvyl transferase family protein n=1 Tax=Bacteroides graminisolvens TaxID=477666 RepID=UPI002409DD5B|nr:polysaccharide pyruvyl transferase family protein [Bacteroides graminisolvens]
MRIGIVTLWQSADNYGQLLQCWALQYYLRSKGHDVFLIKYDMQNNIPFKYKIFKCLKIILVLPLFIKKKYFFNKNVRELADKNKNRRFDDFRSRFISQSERTYKSLKDLQQKPPKAEAYIVGSDQVWAQLLNNKDNEVYFLNFGEPHVKRISYAASFAMSNYPAFLLQKLKKNLERFDSISVREKDGIDICNSVGKISSIVLDPTLLLQDFSYRAIASSRKHSGKYIYIYSINIKNPDELNFSKISHYARLNNYHIVVTPATGYIPGLEIYDDVEYDYASIPEWLSNLDNSQFVVTTSFHGVVFSLILHKKFMYVPLKGEYSSGNNRVLSLLTMLDLSNLCFESETDFERILSFEMNWHKIDLCLHEMKSISIEFINQNL